MGATTTGPEGDRGFAGSIPQIYERHLVPLIFSDYARDLAGQVGLRKPRRILEIAAGTGVVSRELARRLAPDAGIVVTDLNQAMLDQAAAIGTVRPVEWRQADANALPFPNESFDTVICQFGAMFFPDKPKAYREVHRVLTPGGRFAFNVWDRIEENEFADVITTALAALFPNDPPRFLARVPHGYHELACISRDLGAGGFDQKPEAITLAEESRADSAQVPAVAYCEGTPLRNEIESRAPARLREATDFAAAAILKRFGAGRVSGKIQAHVILIEK